jgi:hypothetical protein
MEFAAREPLRKKRNASPFEPLSLMEQNDAAPPYRSVSGHALGPPERKPTKSETTAPRRRDLGPDERDTEVNDERGLPRTRAENRRGRADR